MYYIEFVISLYDASVRATTCRISKTKMVLTKNLKIIMSSDSRLVGISTNYKNKIFN
jgi:hypothetical protein